MIEMILFLMCALTPGNSEARPTNPGPGHFTHGPLGPTPGHPVRL